MRDARTDDRARGLLIGLAVGDALGRPLEFLSLDEIRDRYGSRGLRAPDGPLSPTDDTAMSIAVATALAEAGADGPEALMDAVVRGFIRWAREVRAEDRPGATCLEATSRLSAGIPWRHAAVSWSKGSGAAMRAAPAGFFFEKHPFLLREASRMIARATHGHPTAECAAVAVCAVVREALADTPPDRWVAEAERSLTGLPGWEMKDALDGIGAAVSEAEDASAMERLGEGWVSEEAVAMAIAAVLRHPDDFAAAVACAVNHGGDSDTVGCIAGAIAGARLGEGGLPAEWVALLPTAEEIRALADRLSAARERMG